MLDDIGFYTLTEDRVLQLGPRSPMWRTELIVTDRCNFKCPYCRGLLPALRGDIEISTRLITKSQNNGFNKRADKKEQEFVEIIISDSGSGIPKEIKSNLFEPFVSSKGDGHSGLGLSIAYSIIKGLKGTMSCESDEATGTTFNILLPINDR